MGKVSEFGVAFENLAAKNLITTAQLAETLGFRTFWIPEDYFYRGAFSLASAVACHTTALKVGIGVLNPYTRHPLLTAMEFGALDDVSQGRALLGIGPSLKGWIEDKLKLPRPNPTRALRESVELLRRIFRGETVNFHGRIFQSADARFNFRPAREAIPIHLGVMGAKNLALAGEIADGLLLGGVANPQYIRYAIEQARSGAARAGRTLENFSVSAYLAMSIAEDEKAAREAAKVMAAGMTVLMSEFPEHPIFTYSGVAPEEVRRFGESFARGEFPLALVRDEMIDAFAIAGSPERCRRRLAELVEAGVTHPVVFELPGLSPEQVLHDVHTHLMPYFL